MKKLSAIAGVALLTHLSMHAPSSVAIPSALPVSGEASAGAISAVAKWPVGWRSLPVSVSHSTTIRIQQVRINPHAAMVYVSGSVRPTSGQRALPVLWVKVLQLAAKPIDDNDWVYAVSANSSGQFHEWLHLPFGSGRYEVAVGPALATAQTSLNVRFDERRQVLTSAFDLLDVKPDDNRQLGLLASAWANWLAPGVRALAHTITAKASTPLDKVRAVYNWEAEHIAYDFAEVNNQEDYRWSTAQETLTTREGICVDYSNVADALLRADGIPTQMLVGYASDAGAAVADQGNLAHSWNRSYVDGHWVYFDPTWSRYYLSDSEYILQKLWFDPASSLLQRTHHLASIATR